MTQSQHNVRATVLTGLSAMLALALFVTAPALGQSANNQEGAQADSDKAMNKDKASSDKDSEKDMSKVEVKASTPRQAVQSLHKAISHGDSESAKSLVDTSDDNGKTQAKYIGLLADLQVNANKARQAASEKYGQDVVKQKMKMQDLDQMNPLSSAADNWDALKIDKQGDKATVHIPSRTPQPQAGGQNPGQGQGQNQGTNAQNGQGQRPTKPMQLVKKDGKWRVSSLPDAGKTPGGLEFAVRLLGATNELMTEAPSVIEQTETYDAFKTKMEKRAQKKMQPLMQEMMQKAMQQRQQKMQQQGGGQNGADQGQNQSGQNQQPADGENNNGGANNGGGGM